MRLHSDGGLGRIAWNRFPGFSEGEACASTPSRRSPSPTPSRTTSTRSATSASARSPPTTARSGWGESITQFPEANFAVKAIIDGLAPNLVGKDPVHTEALWRQNKHQGWWYGYGGGLHSYAVAAIDIALWDLKGKALGASVLDLLGGPVHERLPAIASCHAHYE